MLSRTSQQLDAICPRRNCLTRVCAEIQSGVGLSKTKLYNTSLRDQSAVIPADSNFYQHSGTTCPRFLGGSLLSDFHYNSLHQDVCYPTGHTDFRTRLHRCNQDRLLSAVSCFQLVSRAVDEGAVGLINRHLCNIVSDHISNAYSTLS